MEADDSTHRELEIPKVPIWLQGLWSRDYIKQSFREPRQTDVDNIVKYMQGDVFCVDMRMTRACHAMKEVASSIESYSLDDLKLLLELDCFAGMTTVHTDSKGNQVVSWHSVFSFPPNPPYWQDAKSNELLQDLKNEIMNGTAMTEDRGIAIVTDGDSGGQAPAWLELDVATEGSELEERWVSAASTGSADGKPKATRNEADSKESAVRAGFSVLVTCGDHFAYVRDMDGRTRQVLHEKFGERSARDVIEDESVPMCDKRMLFGAEFSYGSCNGSDRVSDWVIEHSTLPFKVGKHPV
eukprot:TRINITY_DN57160_c0_g1_i1.p1 TRINITY_DN57160_c0_g1~~TRINITY_DN57160_c0_g1_i1.p1  ORF type:complete len:297 (-),score=42.52 TRINITY_DN57160_c0_g1_i1:141-1031(-)